MKNITFFLALFLTLMKCSYAQDDLHARLDRFRNSVRQKIAAAPRLNVAQKTAIGGIIELHRAGLRKDLEEIRRISCEIRHDFRDQLSREQLLHILDVRDEFVMRLPLMQATLFLSRLENSQRAEILQAIRQLWRGDKKEIPQNLDRIYDFFLTHVCPIVADELSLNERQKAWGMQLLAEKHSLIREHMVCLLERLFVIRAEIFMVLGAEQKAFIELQQDEIFRELCEYLLF